MATDSCQHGYSTPSKDGGDTNKTRQNDSFAAFLVRFEDLPRKQAIFDRFWPHPGFLQIIALFVLIPIRLCEFFRHAFIIHRNLLRKTVSVSLTLTQSFLFFTRCIHGKVAFKEFLFVLIWILLSSQRSMGISIFMPYNSYKPESASIGIFSGILQIR